MNHEEELIDIESDKVVPYMQPLDYRQIKLLRMLRNKTQRDFAEMIGTTASVLCTLETGKRPFTPYYEDKVRDALRRLAISNKEILVTRQLINRKRRKRYTK